MTSESEHFYAGRELEVLTDVPRYYQWIAANFADFLRGEAVEVGAGIGTFSKFLVSHVDCLDLVEPSPNLVSRLHDDFGAEARVRIFPTTFEDYVSARSPESRDVVIMINVLEHFADDEEALRSALSLLRPGGHLLVFVPALPFLYGKMDESLGHYRRYSRSGLGSLAARTGCQVVRLGYFDVLGVLPWWLVHRVIGSTRFSPRMTKIYDTIGVPLTRTFESVVSPPIGKNLILVVRASGES